MKVHNNPDGRDNMLKSLQSINTSYNLISIDMPGLALVGDENDSVSVKLARVLSNSQNLEYLNLSDIGIRKWNEIGSALLSCPKLKRFDFSINKLSPKLFDAFSKCLVLEDLGWTA
jgi:hypothetical protein